MRISTIAPNTPTSLNVGVMANRWIAKAGPDHYAEHLPRFREWVAHVAAG